MGYDAGEVAVTYSASVDAFIANAKTADAALENSGKVAEVVSRRQKEAAEMAAKFEAEAVEDSTKKILAARQQVSQATADYARVSGMVRAGMLEEAQGAQALQGSYQRLVTARKQLAQASQEAAAAEKAESLATKTAGEAAAAASILHLRNAAAMKAEAEASAMATASGGHLGNSAKTVSGAFMEMEGRMPIRALERMIGQSTMLAPLMEAAFPVVGAIAGAEAIADVTGEVTKLYDEWFNYRDAVDAAMQKDMQMAAQFEKDAEQGENLRRTLMELEGGRSALAASGYSPASGVAPTSRQLEIEERGERQAGAKYTLDQDANNIALVQGQLEAATKKADALHSIVDGITYGNRKTAEIEVGPADMAVTNAQQQLSNAQAQQNVDTAQVQKNNLREASGLQQQAQQEAQKNAAAARKASEDKLRAMETGRQKEILEGRLGAQADLDYWTLRIGAFSSKSSEYLNLQKKVNEDRTSLARSGEQYAQERARGAETGARNMAALVEANTQLDLASHRITKLEADQRNATAQTAEYIVKLKSLNDELDRLSADRTLAPEDRRNRTENVRNQIDDLSGQHAAQMVHDQAQQAGDAEDALHALKEQADATSDLTAAQEKQAAAAAQMSLAHRVAIGEITKESEAQQMAALHVAEYTAQMTKLNGDRAAISDDDKLTDQQKQLALTKLDTQAATATGTAERQAQTDQWTEFYSTGVGGATQALEEFTAASKDSAAQTRALTSDTLKGINDVLVKGISTPHEHWRRDLGNYGAGLFRNVANVGLNRGEGALLRPVAGFMDSQGSTGKRFEQMLGIGKDGKKPVGTSSDPLYVKFAEDSAGGGGGALDSLHSAMDKARKVAGMTTPQSMSPDLMAALGVTQTATQDWWRMLFAGSGFGGDGAAYSPAGPSSTSTPIPASGTSKALAGLIGNVASFAGFFAEGGDFPGDSTAIVGEKGPELVHFGRAGSVTPNNKLDDVVGGGGFRHIGNVHVDARGSTDPAATEAAVHRGYSAAVRDSMTGNAHAQAEKQRRVPALVRG